MLGELGGELAGVVFGLFSMTKKTFFAFTAIICRSKGHGVEKQYLQGMKSETKK